MGFSNVVNGFHFHQAAEGGLAAWHEVGPAAVDKHLIIQEREVRYRVTSHQHPFVGRLMQRLVGGDAFALLDADTEFVRTESPPRSPARPDSVEFALGADVVLIIPREARAALITEVTATVAGVPRVLAKSFAVKIGPIPAQAKVHGIPPSAPRMKAILLDELADLPVAGSPFDLPDNSQAIVRGNTSIKLESATSVILTGGITAILPPGTVLALADGTVISYPNGTSATLLRGQRKPVLFAPALEAYGPTAMVNLPYPVNDLDFRYGGAYSVYNWELFFHVPLTLAIHLSKNGRYAEAQRWFHCLFDPTDSSDGPTPERFWKVLPFQTAEVRRIEETLVNLATGADVELRDQTIRSINAWKNAPFRPHVIARNRQGAYMLKTVTAYLDNLIAWGDSLFRQDTGEAIDEALMLYVLAANILGPRPQRIPPKGTIRPQTYQNLRAGLKQFGVVLREFESVVPFEQTPLPSGGGADTSSLATLRSLGQALYFCVPRNDRLLGYWDTVADRLFKIRNSLNIQGIFRRLALFEPPIDPALLVRATAAGLDVGTIVNGVNQPLPLVRFQVLAQRASEIAQEVKSLGSHLLSAMEKEDGEALAILRARHERAVMTMVEQVKYGQLQEAAKSRESLLTSLALAVQRYTYYELQLGKKQDEIEKAIPELTELDKASLERLRFKSREPDMALRQIEVDIAQDLGESGGKIVSSLEREELHKSRRAREIQETVKAVQLAGQALSVVPGITLDTHFWGVGSSLTPATGVALGRATAFFADSILARADGMSYEARLAEKTGSFARREQDWAFQSNLAAGEINQIFKQLRAAQIREAVAELELKSHRLQMKHAEEIERFLNEEGTSNAGKKTNKALYTFEKREVRGLYSQSFQLAFEIARKAERALQQELGDRSLSYLQFGYQSGKEDLLAGEKLYLDIKRMETAYHDLNQREYELTKHVSLLQVDPLALIQLRATGRCTVRLSEDLFDMDGPGHYFRRIKTVAVSVPCVTGPYASVNCTLTLIKSSIRRTPAIPDGYERSDAEDSRFDDYFGSLQSIVASTGQNDSGLFEPTLRDERYLPFENSGVISEWQLQLPADPSKNEPAQFDYETISDIILHVRYTAREGGAPLRKAAVSNLKERIAKAKALGSVRLFSIRHEFPNEWASFQSVTLGGAASNAELSLVLSTEHYPLWLQDALQSVKRLDIVAQTTAENITVTHSAGGQLNQVTLSGQVGNLRTAKLDDDAPLPAPIGQLTLSFSSNAMEDLWIAVTVGNI